MSEPPDPGQPPTPSRSRPQRAARARDTVEVPRAWLAVLAGGLIVALLVVAYLVGRESGRKAVRVDPRPSEMDTGTPAFDDDYDDDDSGYVAELDDAPAGLPPEEQAPDAGSFDPWPSGGAPSDASPGSSGRPPPRGADPQSTAVAAYLVELEGYEQGAKYWNNPQELAMRLIGQGAQGDTSGFRQLVETQRSAQRQIESMVVPAPCAEHHRRTVEVMGGALELLEKLEGGVASGNLDGLLALTGESRQLEADAREVDALAAELRRRFGV